MIPMSKDVGKLFDQHTRVVDRADKINTACLDDVWQYQKWPNTGLACSRGQTKICSLDFPSKDLPHLCGVSYCTPQWFLNIIYHQDNLCIYRTIVITRFDDNSNIHSANKCNPSYSLQLNLEEWHACATTKRKSKKAFLRTYPENIFFLYIQVITSLSTCLYVHAQTRVCIYRYLMSQFLLFSTSNAMAQSHAVAYLYWNSIHSLDSRKPGVGCQWWWHGIA